MNKSERETQDFMNVESFSQLPFIRPAPKEKPAAATGIRLFGIKFDPADDPSDHSSGAASASKPDGETFKASSVDSDINNMESSRRFECHYCCRNFPTSQALGGHQNAHKRERQHAKQANLQSAIAAHGSLSDIYGFGTYGTSPAEYNGHPQWGYGGSRYNTNNQVNNYYTSSAFGHRAYNHRQPINGNPFWRIPTASGRQPTSREPLPLLGHDVGDGSGQLGRAEGVYACEAKAGMQDPVSLDLHSLALKMTTALALLQ